MNGPSEQHATGSHAARVMERLAALHLDYLAALPVRAGWIDALWRSFREEGNRTAGREAVGDVHRLAGNAALFGFARLGTEASETEAVLEAALDGKPAGGAADERLRRLLAAMALAGDEAA